MRFLALAALVSLPLSIYGSALVNLGTADTFAVLAGSTVTNTGTTIINGNVGLSPGTAITGFGLATITPPGTEYVADAVAAQAEADLTTAYNYAAAQPCTDNLTGQDLGGLTLTPGVDCFTSAALLTGTLTLNAQGDPDAAFLIQIGSTLTTASNSSVIFINDAGGSSVFWQVGTSATLGSGTSFEGNILASASITLNTGTTISCGSALAQTGGVTLDANTVSIETAACDSGSGSGSGSGPSATPEPSTALLLAPIGLGWLLLRRSRMTSRPL